MSVLSRGVGGVQEGRPAENGRAHGTDARVIVIACEGGQSSKRRRLEQSPGPDRSASGYWMPAFAGMTRDSVQQRLRRADGGCGRRRRSRRFSGGTTISDGGKCWGLRLGGVFVLVAFRSCGDLLGDEAGVLADGGLDAVRDVRILLEEDLGVLAALADALAVVGEPRAGLFDHAALDAEIEDLAGLGNALAVHDVELDLLERRRELVLHHFDAGLVADDLLALLDGADPA